MVSYPVSCYLSLFLYLLFTYLLSTIYSYSRVPTPLIWFDVGMGWGVDGRDSLAGYFARLFGRRHGGFLQYPSSYLRSVIYSVPRLACRWTRKECSLGLRGRRGAFPHQSQRQYLLSNTVSRVLEKQSDPRSPWFLPKAPRSRSGAPFPPAPHAV